ncbi:peptidoglycan-binding domain-containing protein [Paraglaciecola hydrolytica]|uniref:Peptidoglycan binding-like domain-containing protein n=1 Tax=Paraglaciecola hydrolytica TaxID=1799789 RepID=A0A136A2Y4_9ALTE|nr:peptidoglycan-binding domain-containing protein [Paraglaciecola hydrolytica]KXI29595.1 hypothetical protein AX660_05945 [Paraglaciecola hydrolytica]
MGIEQLGDAIDHSIQNGQLPDLDKSEAPYLLYRKRLFWLGYLYEENGADVMDEALSQGIKAFQSDVGIKETGKPNAQTFLALDSLVAFEPRHDNALFLAALAKDNPALHKARKLKLSMYGLLKSSSWDKEFEVDSAFLLFKQLLIALQIPTINDQSDRIELERHLFNIDLISNNINGKGKDIYFKSPYIDRNKKLKFLETLDIFIRNIAAIELWLYGYPIELSRLQSGNITISNSLKRFWRESPQSERPRLSERDSISYRFFKRINILQSYDVKESESVVSEKILSELKNKSFRDSIEKESETFLSRVWDGIKRVTRFIFDILRRLSTSVLTLIQNAARWLISSGRTIFTSISTIFKTTQVGYAYLFKQGNANNLEHVVVQKSIDFDLDIYVNTHGNVVLINGIFKKQNLSAKLFRLGLTGVMKLWHIFRKLVASFSGATWLILFWSFAKLKQDFEYLENLVSDSVSALKEWDTLSDTQ